MRISLLLSSSSLKRNIKKEKKKGNSSNKKASVVLVEMQRLVYPLSLQNSGSNQLLRACWSKSRQGGRQRTRQAKTG